MKSQSSTRYDTLSLAFHWITAIAVAIAFVLGPEHFGRLMHQGLDPATRSDIVWHESLGLLVLALTVLRLGWMALRPAAPAFEMSQAMELAAKAVRLGLWLLMLALPLTALLALGSEGHPLTLLGGLRLDQMPLVANSAFAKLADWGDVHGFLGDAIMALAGLHAAAAIYHPVLLKDGVLKSMLPHGH
ncbi:MAG: cytochrome b/b6 domain-containing protein [Rhodoferax sp.]|nr:cytochrome b/b6 domain-containing protein [Rhodoferax sp.]